MNNKKRQQIKEMDTSLLRNVLASRPGPDPEPSPEFPLAGQVRIEGLGQFPIKSLRAELIRRDADEMIAQTDAEARIARVKAGETSAMEEIAGILGVKMTPEQRARELRAQEQRVAAARLRKEGQDG